MIRLQKILSTAGVASRRASEQLILEGRVTVNGETIRELGAKAEPGKDDIRVDGSRVKTAPRVRYILLHKPKGFVTTRRDPEGRRTVLDLLKNVGYVYPVGRLDYDTEGLLLLTSDGDLAAALLHPSHEVARIYEAIVKGVPDDAAMARLSRGVHLDGRRTGGADVKRGSTVGKGRDQTTKLILTLREGRNRQVRRMCAAVGHPVRRLVRVRMGPIALGDLRPGEWRELMPPEVAKLRRAAGL
jgi:pseudouridine synthase